MLLTKCVYSGDEKVGGTVNNTGGAKNIVIPHSDKARLHHSDIKHRRDLLKISPKWSGKHKQCNTKCKQAQMTGGEDYSEDTVVQQGTKGGSRLVLAFTGPAWSPGPTSVGL